MSFNNISKKTMFILYCIILIPVLIFFSVAVYRLCFDSITSKEYYVNEKRDIEVHSNLVLVFRDKNNHNAQTLKFKDTLFTIPPDWEDKFKIGDSISKDKGVLKVEHYRNGKLLEILDYNNVAKNMD